MTHEQYIYLGQLQPLWETTIQNMPLKIGLTTNPDAREIQLSRTKCPFEMKFIRLWEIPSNKNLKEEEDWFHDFFDSTKITDSKGSNTEYFTDDGSLTAKMEMLMDLKGYTQVLDLDEVVKKAVAPPKKHNGLSQSAIDFWNAFDQKEIPEYIKPVGAITSWNRCVSAGKGFQWEYITWGRGKTGGGAGLWTHGNKPSRLDILFSDNMKEKLRKEFPTIVFKDTKSRIYIPVEGDRSLNGGFELQDKLIDTMSQFYDIMYPIIKDLP